MVSNGRLALLFSTRGRADLKGALSGYAVDVRPHVGFEAGRTLGGPIGQRTEKSILRLKAGLAGQIRFEFERPQLRAIVLDVDFVYRQLYTEETFGWWATHLPPPETRRKDEDGAPGATIASSTLFTRTMFTGTGRHPRRYLNAAVRFVFNRYWELFASYVRGELPPRFVRVDKMQAGFAFRLGTRQ